MTRILVKDVMTYDVVKPLDNMPAEVRRRLHTVATVIPDEPTRDYVEHADAIPKVLQLGDVSLGDGKLIRDTLVEALQPLASGRTPGRTLSAQDCKDLAIYTAKIWNGKTGTPVEVQRRATVLLRDSIFDVAGQLSVGATTAVEFADLATRVFDAKLNGNSAATSDASGARTQVHRTWARSIIRPTGATTHDAARTAAQPSGGAKRPTIAEINEANRKYAETLRTRPI